MEEKFDVLTETGEYANRIESRENCHKYGFWHKAVAMFMINSKGQVLLQKRSANKKLWPNMWDMTAGGHVLAGEFGFEAIIREIQEELGIEINKNDILFIGSAVSTNIKGDIINRHFNEYYIINKDVDEKTLNLQIEEVADIKWFDKDEVLERIKNINERMPAYKGIKGIVLSEKPLIKTTTNKIKRQEEIKTIEQ